VILRILVQESPDSKLRLKRYEGLKFQGQNWNIGSLGFIWKYRMLEDLMCKKTGV
jgi:hypothetical protein